MRFFVTGISGFVGIHLTRRLLEAGHEVRGMATRVEAPGLAELGQRFPGRLQAEPGDIRDGERLRQLLAAARPDGVIHLAGIAFAPRAARDPRTAYEVNFLGGVELLAAVRDVASRARVVFPSSGDAYGWIDPGDLPIREHCPLRPVSPYGVSKAAADLAAFQFFWSDRLDVVRVRPFNHTGPGQAPQFVCSEFARGIAEAEAGLREPVLRVGNLEVERDFHDVRDTVRAYLDLFERGRPGEAYNVASGRSVTVREVLERLLARSRRPIRIEVDPEKRRPREIPRVTVSVEKVERETGWRAEIPLERTLGDLLDWWRSQRSGGANR
jgi:GDP-4-dehydro-6-deoxy-D-mannose reductase